MFLIALIFMLIEIRENHKNQRFILQSVIIFES